MQLYYDLFKIEMKWRGLSQKEPIFNATKKEPPHFKKSLCATFSALYLNEEIN